VGRGVAAEIDKVAAHLASHADPALQGIGLQLAAATAALHSAIDWMVRSYGANPRAAHAVAVPYLKLWGITAGGWQMGRAALIAATQLAAGTGSSAFWRTKIATARYYADAILPQAEGLAHAITQGAEAALALTADEF